MQNRNALELLQMHPLPPRKHHIGIEDALRVEELLDCPHQLVCLLAPFGAHKGCHVPSCAVLGFERAAELQHTADDLLHELAVALLVCWAAQGLWEHKMQVPVLGMPEDDGIRVAEALEELLEPPDGLRKRLHRYGDILADGGGPGSAPRCNRRVEAPPGSPELLLQPLLLRQQRRTDTGEFAEKGFGCAAQLLQFGRGGALVLKEQGSGVLRE